MRILALDYGDRTIGVAVSDPLGVIATGVGVIRRSDENGLKESMARLSAIIKDYGAGRIVLGYPKNMNNTEGFRCEKTKLFKRKLEGRFPGIPVILWDERLSTVAALASLKAAPRGKAREKTDELAAVFFLQGYLDSLAGGPNNNDGGKAVKDMDNKPFDEDFDENNVEDGFFEDEDYEMITLIDDDGEEMNLVVLDSGSNEEGEYLLVVESEFMDEEENEASILKCLNPDEDGEPLYEFVEDDDEFERAQALFFEDEPEEE